MKIKKRLITNHYSLITNFGFTLLELLVVIGIISILMALATLTFGAAQKKGRDARRKTDLKAIQDSFEQYYAMHSSEYPGSGSCDSGDTINISASESFLIPTDPRDPTYSYTASSCSTSGYCICVELESGSGGNASNGSCSWQNNGAYFCVKNLQ